MNQPLLLYILIFKKIELYKVDNLKLQLIVKKQNNIIKNNENINKSTINNLSDNSLGSNDNLSDNSIGSNDNLSDNSIENNSDNNSIKSNDDNTSTKSNDDSIKKNIIENNKMMTNLHNSVIIKKKNLTEDDLEDLLSINDDKKIENNNFYTIF